MDSELSRLVVVDELPNHGQTIKISASETERTAIANRLDVVLISKLESTIAIRPEIGREFSAEGNITVEFVQTCVVSGDPIDQTLDFPLNRRYSTDADEFRGLQVDDDILTDPHDDGPDPIENGVIDIGEAVVEEFALQIPPYPKASGAEFTDIITEDDEKSEDDNPFSKLADLKNNLKTNN